MQIIFCSILCFLVSASRSIAQQCNPSAPARTPCGDAGSDTNRQLCLQKACCYDNSGSREPRCYAKTGGSSRDYAALLRQAEGMITPPPRPTDTGVIQQAATLLNVSVKNEIVEEARNFNFAGLATLAYPKCPLNVPACHRIACQPGNAMSEQNPQECYRDPRCCFDTELFKYKYVFGVNYLGGTPVCYIGPTSLRYAMVARMIQPWNPFFQEPVVNIFERVFNLNQDVMSMGICWEATITNIDFNKTPKCGWIGITRMECHLKGCCYSDSQNECVFPRRLHGGTTGFGNFGNQGNTMMLASLFGGRSASSSTSSGGQSSANPFNLLALSALTGGNTGANPFGSFFGNTGGFGGLTGGFPGMGGGFGGNPGQGMSQDQQDRLQYPDLYQSTSDQCDTGFGSNPLTQFRRMPCWNNTAGGGLTGDSYIKLMSQCPSVCCKNIYALVPSFGDMSMLGGLGGSSGGMSNMMNMMMMQQMVPGFQQPSAQQLSSFYCPYFFTPIPGFGDLTPIVKDCCFQHACYHKGLTARSGSTGGTGIGTGGTGIGTGFGSASWNQWGQWSGCSGRCNQQGTKSRTRVCMQYGRQVNNFNCPGQGTETLTCYGQCQGQAQWTQWANVGSCQYDAYGRGRQTRQRQCQSQWGQSSYGCPGNSQDTVTCQAQRPAQWTQWQAVGACSAQYGQGTQRRQRSCVDSYGSQQNTCPGLSTDSIRCQGSFVGSCSWSAWSSLGACSATCGRGTRTSVRNCVAANPSQNCRNQCLGIPQRTVQCQMAPCPPSTPWVSWGSYGLFDSGCQYGGSTQMRRRRCLYRGSESTPIGDDFCTYKYGSQPGATQTTVCPRSGSEQSTTLPPFTMLPTQAPSTTLPPFTMLPTTQPTTRSSSRDFVWTGWTQWGACSSSCGSGVKRRSRICYKLSARRRADGECNGEAQSNLACWSPCN